MLNACRFSIMIPNVTIFALLWLTCTIAGERVHNLTNEMSSANVVPNNHRSDALNTFIKDLIQAEEELGNLKQESNSFEKLSYTSNDENSGSASQISAQAEENMNNHNNVRHTHYANNMYTDTGKRQDMFHANNKQSKLTTRHSGQLSHPSVSNYENKEDNPNFDENEDDIEMLKYLSSNYPKGNRLLQKGQMQEKQTLDNDRLSQMFSAMKKNYFPSTVHVNEGDDKISEYDNRFDLEGANEPRPLNNDRSNYEKEALDREPRHLSHLEDNTHGIQFTVTNDLRYGGQLDDRHLDKNEVSNPSSLENNFNGGKYPAGNEPIYANRLESYPSEENFAICNEPRYARYLKSDSLSDENVAAGKEIGPASYSADNLNHIEHSQLQVRSASIEDQSSDAGNSDQCDHKSLEEEGADPAVVKYFQTHGQRHNRKSNVDSSKVTSDGDLVKCNSDDCYKEPSAEPSDEEKLKQARERLQLEDADGLLIGMHGRVGTTDNQMEVENIKQDKVKPKDDEEEDLQQQLEEEKVIFYPFIPGQSNPIPIHASDNIEFANDHEQNSRVSHESNFPNTMSQLTSDTLKHLPQTSDKQLQGLHGQNQELGLENDGTELTNDHNMAETDRKLSEGDGTEPVSSHVDRSDEYVSRTINKRSHHVHPQFKQNLIMHGLNEFYPSHNLRHLLHFDDDTYQQMASLQKSNTDSDSMNAEAMHLYLLSNNIDNSFRNEPPHSHIAKQTYNTIRDTSGITNLEKKSSNDSDVSKRYRRSVVKKPGAIWQDESNEESDEGEEETNREECDLGYNEFDAKVKHSSSFNPAVGVRSSIHRHTNPVDSSIAFEPTADSNFQLLMQAKREAQEIQNANTSNYNKQNKDKRFSKNRVTNDVALHKFTDVVNGLTADYGDGNNDIQKLKNVKNKLSQLNDEKKEVDWHRNLNEFANTYVNDKTKNEQIGVGMEGNIVAREKHEAHPFQLDAQRIKPGLGENGVDESNNAEQDSNTDQTEKLTGTNGRPLLEKTSNGYEDVSKELKQVMNNLNKENVKRGPNKDNAGNLLKNEFNAESSMPLDVVKQGSASLTEKSQTHASVNSLHTNSKEETDDGLVAYHSNLESHDGTEAEDSNDMQGQQFLSKQISNDNRLIPEEQNDDVKEEQEVITPENLLFNDVYDAFVESPLFDRDDISSWQSHNIHSNTHMKRNNHLQHSRKIPQDLLDINVSTKELDRLISEGNLPVLKRVKRSINGSAISKCDNESNDEMYTGKKEISKSLEVDLNKQPRSSYAVPDDVGFGKDDYVFLGKSFRGRKHGSSSEHLDCSEDRHTIAKKEVAKPEWLNETKQKFSLLTVKDVSPDDADKVSVVNFAPIPDVGTNNVPNKMELSGDIQGSSELVKDEGPIQQISLEEHANVTSAKNYKDHLLNKREIIYHQSGTGNVNNFPNSHIVHKHNENELYSNYRGREFDGMRKNTNSDMIDDLQHGSLRSTDVMSHFRNHGQNEEGDSEVTLQKRNNVGLTGGVKNNRRKIKSIGTSDGMIYSIPSLVIPKEEDTKLEPQQTNGMFKGSASNDFDTKFEPVIPNSGFKDGSFKDFDTFGKFEPVKSNSGFKDGAFKDLDTFDDSLLDDVLNDRNSHMHEDKLSRDTDSMNTFPDFSPEVSDKANVLSSHDGWQPHDAFESDYIATLPDELPKSDSPYSTSKLHSNDPTNHLHSEKESHSSMFSHVGDSHHYFNGDDSPKANLNHYNTDHITKSQKSYSGNKGDKLHQSAGNKKYNEKSSSSKSYRASDTSQYKNGNDKFGYSESNNDQSRSSYLNPGQYDSYPNLAPNSKQPNAGRSISKSSMCSQQDDSVPSFPTSDQKHAKPYNGELDDGLLGMNIVDNILNQVYGSKQLQAHIGPGLHRNYLPTKVEKPNSLTRTRQKMMSQISTVIDKGLEEEMKQRTCIQLPSVLQDFLDWLEGDGSPPSTNDKSSNHHVCNPNNHNKSQNNCSSKTRSLLLKKIKNDYDHLSKSEKEAVQSTRDVAIAYKTVVNTLQDDLDDGARKMPDSKKSSSTKDSYHAHHDFNTITNLTSSKYDYNMPIFNFDDNIITSPLENASNITLLNNFDLPLSYTGLSDLPILNSMTGDNDIDINPYLTPDLGSLGLQGSRSTNIGSYPVINMDHLETKRSDEEAYLNHRIYTDASPIESGQFGDQTSDSRWPPMYTYQTAGSQPKNRPVHYFRDAHNEGYPPGPLKSGNRAYYDGAFEAPRHVDPPTQNHITNEYKRLLARAEQIRRKRSRGEKNKEIFLEQ